jgi:hypothetical protein
MKRMQHPLHGFHHCYTPQEEESMRANGWIDEEQDDVKTQGDDHIALIKSVISESFAPPVRDKIRGNRRGTR